MEGLNWKPHLSVLNVSSCTALALTREALGRASKSASSLLLLLALALIHVLGHCPSSRSPVLLSLSFTCLLSSPTGSALCRQPFLVTQTRPYLRLLAQSTNSGGESRNTAGLPNFFAEAIVSTGNPIVRKRLTLYDGTIGAHGMHALHSLTGRESPPDGNAYMISAPDNGDDAGS